MFLNCIIGALKKTKEDDNDAKEKQAAIKAASPPSFIVKKSELDQPLVMRNAHGKFAHFDQ
jgi:hypothetical protein